MLAARLNSADLNQGGGTLLIDAISAAVIGGTSLFGGRGEIRNALFGALVIATIANGLNTLGYSSGVIFIVTGVILLLAVTLDTLARAADAGQGADDPGGVDDAPFAGASSRRPTSTASCSRAPRSRSEVDVVAVGSRDLGAGAGVRATSTASRAAYGSYEELLADPVGRGDLQPAAEHAALRVVDPRARGGQARALREADVVETPPRSRRRSPPRSAPASCSPRPSCTATTRRRSASRSCVAEGAIGDLRLIRSAFSYGLFDESNIRLRTDVDGGSLMDVGCYCISGSRLLGGEPEAVFGRAYIGPTGTDWAFTGSLRFPGDVLALFDCATCLTERDELEAIGSEGSLFLDDPWHCQNPVIELRRRRRRRAHRRGGRRIRTSSSWRISAARSAPAVRRCWAARTPLRRPV